MKPVFRIFEKHPLFQGGEKGWMLGVMVLGVLIAGCSGISDPNQIVFPATNVSYKVDIAPYFSLACSESGCHDQATPNNDEVDLTSWVGVRAYNVAPTAGDTTCHLVLVMYGREAHAGVLVANDNQRQGIKQWVLEGAKDN
jgi:hypothetical protein